VKIGFFLPANNRGGFDPKLGGGSELALYYLATQLAKMGVEVHVVIEDQARGQKTVSGVHVHTYSMPSNPLGAYTSTKKVLGDLCSQARLDLLVGFELSTPWSKVTCIDALIRVTKSSGLRLVYYVGNHYPWLVPKDESNPWMLWRSLRRAANVASTVIAASTIMARAVARNAGVDPTRISVVPFGVPLEEYAPRDADRDARRGRVVFTGRIVPHKGLRELIEAARILKDTGDQKIFTLIGPRGNLWEDTPGQYYLELQRLSEAYGLGSTFRFTGSLPREQVVRIMNSSNVFAFPSHAEGFGVALIQAMASGAVPVVYRIEPLTEIVGEAGAYAELGDPHSLADAIRRADSDPRLPGLIEGRVKQYSIQRVASQFLDALDGKLAKQSAKLGAANGGPEE
jgi:glycosyltransferase involved in cell wall biosynthesis